MRAQILLDQDRYAQAEQSIRLALAEESDNPLAHTWLALTLTEQDRHAEAETEAGKGVELDPEDSYSHYMLAYVYFRWEKLKQSRDVLLNAIQINPDAADYFELLARIAMLEKNWKQGLDVVEHGLSLDPDHVECTNLRALVLVQLGRKKEAEETIDQSMASEPENATAHGVHGMTLLRQRRHVEATRSFLEALRLEPTLEWARDGLVDSLQSRNSVYRLFLRYSVWINSLTRKGQFGVIFGAFLIFRVLRNVAESDPTWAPYIWPILGLYIAFVLLTWIGKPVADLLLRLDRTGRQALSSSQIYFTNWIGGLFAIALISAAIAFVYGRDIGYLAAAVFAVMTIPFSAIYQLGEKRTKTIWKHCAMGLVAIGIVALVLSITGVTWDYVFYVLFFLGWISFLLAVRYVKT